MKKTQFLATLLLITVFAVSTPVSASAMVTDPVERNEARANQLKNRLEEIKAMDVKTLTKSEKRALRGEVRAIKKELKAISGGVYLSVGALLLIILLIILLV